MAIEMQVRVRCQVEDCEERGDWKGNEREAARWARDNDWYVDARRELCPKHYAEYENSVATPREGEIEGAEVPPDTKHGRRFNMAEPAAEMGDNV